MPQISSRRAADAGIALFLFLANLVLIAPYLSIDFSSQPWNNDYIYIGMTRMFRDRPWTWNNLRYAGTPFQYLYPPLMHVLVCITPVHSLGRAYHLVTGAGYALVPVALYIVARRLFHSQLAAFFTAASYSFLPSPVYLLGPWESLARGFHDAPWSFVALIQYNESAHTLALMIALLAAAFAWRGRWRLASVCGAAAFLCNLVGAIAFLMALAAVGVARSRTWGLRTALLRTAGAAGCAWGLAAFWITPGLFHIESLLDRVVLRQDPIPPPWNGTTWMILACAAALIVLALWRRVPAVPAFLLAWLAISGAVVVSYTFAGNWVLSVPNRYVQEFNIGLLLAAGYLVSIAGKWRIPIVAGLLLIGGIAGRGFLRHAWEYPAKSVDPGTLVSAQVARRLSEVAGSSRVLVSGELEGSLGIWSDVPQLSGNFQGIGNYWTVTAKKELTFSCADIAVAPRIAELWMRALDLRYAVVHGPESREYFHWFARPERFAGMPVAWTNGGGDTIYSLPPPEEHQAVVVDLDRLESVGRPRASDDLPFLERYAAWAHAKRPARIRWSVPGRAELEAELKPGEGVLVKMNYDRGWSVSSGALQADPIGFLVIRAPAGHQRLELSFAGAWDLWLGRGLTLLTIVLLLARVPVHIAGLAALIPGLLAYAALTLGGPPDLAVLEQSYRRLQPAMISPGGIVDKDSSAPPPLVRGRGISIWGANFGSARDSIRVWIGNRNAEVLFRGPNLIAVTLPADTPPQADVTVEVNGCRGNSFLIATRAP